MASAEEKSSLDSVLMTSQLALLLLFCDDVKSLVLLLLLLQ